MVQRLIQKIRHQLKRLSGKTTSAKPVSSVSASKAAVTKTAQAVEKHVPRPATRPKLPSDRRPVADHRPLPASPRPAQKPWSPADYVIPVMEGKTRFSDLGMPDPILHAVADLGFKYCMPVQAMAIPPALEGRDIAGKAQTGTGKTAAFLVAVFTHFLRNPRKTPGKLGAPRALILAPTRELVIQIESDAQDIGKYCGFKVFGVYGGMDYDKQQRQLQTSSPDVLVATPGRLLDFRRGGLLDLSRVEVLVIDEADRMLDMGFIPDVRTIVYSTPPKEKRQTLLFSATLTDDILRLASRWMNAPVMVEIEAETMTVDAIKQVVYTVPADKKFALFYNLLQRDKPERVLMFCNRRDETERVMYLMARYGINAALLSGAVPQKKRLQVLEGFRSGTIRVLVATDVAGRGLHVDAISHVINYDIPLDAEDYVHRIGRTGRAGADGIAYTFACENAAFSMPEIEKYIGRSLDYENPEPALLVLPPPTHAAPHMERPPERRPAYNAGRAAPRGRYGASRSRR